MEAALGQPVDYTGLVDAPSSLSDHAMSDPDDVDCDDPRVRVFIDGDGDSDESGVAAAALVSAEPGDVVAVDAMRSPLAWLRHLRSCVGPHLLTMLASGYAVKGFVYTCLTLLVLPFLKSLNADGIQFQRYGTAAMIPWSCKGFVGVLSDTVALGGYAKKGYILASTVMGSCALLALTMVTWTSSMITLAVMLLTLSHFNCSVVDLLCEGRYTCVMRENPETGTGLVSWVWLVYYPCALAGALLVGQLADAGMYGVVFGVCAAVAAQVSIPTALNWLGETPLPPGRPHIDVAKVRRHSRIYVAAILFAVAGLGLAVVNMVGSHVVVLVYAVAISGLVACLLYWAFPQRIMASCVLYVFLTNATYVNIQGALDYFYTAAPDCVAHGPHFSYTYYSTWSPIVTTIFGGISVALFQAKMSTWPFRRVFWVAIGLRIVAATVDVAIVRRWNIAMHIPDHVFYMAGITFAIVSSCQNFGSAVGKSIGVYAIRMFGVKTVVPCNFDHLSLLIVLAHMLLPALCIPLTFYLLPSTRVCDPLPTMDTLADSGMEEGDVALRIFVDSESSSEGEYIDDE